MAKKKIKDEGGENKEESAPAIKNGSSTGGNKNDKDAITVVLTVDMHCDGCTSKIIKSARGFKGVETVKVEMEASKLTVVGKVDPVQIREYLHTKMRKNVSLISPQPKKLDDHTGDQTQDAENKKPKEAPVTTAVLRLRFHCQGCTEKIRKLASKTKGVREALLDKEKETVTVRGNMDANALAETLRGKLKRPVEIVPCSSKKENDRNGAGNNNGEGRAAQDASGEEKKKKNGASGGAKQDGSRPEITAQPAFCPGYFVYGYPPEYGYGNSFPVHMKFNDENPNACCVM